MYNWVRNTRRERRRHTWRLVGLRGGVGEGGVAGGAMGGRARAASSHIAPRSAKEDVMARESLVMTPIAMRRGKNTRHVFLLFCVLFTLRGSKPRYSYKVLSRTHLTPPLNHHILVSNPQYRYHYYYTYYHCNSMSGGCLFVPILRG
jgi:hypothetical protein